MKEKVSLLKIAQRTKAIDALLDAVKYIELLVSKLQAFENQKVRLAHKDEVAYYDAKKVNEIIESLDDFQIDLKNKSFKLSDLINAINYDLAEDVFNDGKKEAK